MVQISTLNVLDGGVKDKRKGWDYEYRHLLKNIAQLGFLSVKASRIPCVLVFV